MRFTVTIAVFVLLALGGMAACGGDDNGGAGSGYGDRAGSGSATTTESTEAEPAIGTIVVRDGKPVGGVQELEYDAGEEVRFRVRSDAADEVHVHGYDVSREVPAGASATISFAADIEGIFEVEMHSSEEQIAELRVNP